MTQSLSTENIVDVAEDILSRAKQKGASAVEVRAAVEKGFAVNVRLGDVETIEYNQDNGIGVTVYFGQRKGSATTTDTRRQSIEDTVEAACGIAKYTEEDDCAGLADAQLMASEILDLDLYYPWDITPEQAIDKAIQCESLARERDKRITNSEGASISTHEKHYIYANSHGFSGSYPSTSHSLSCELLGQKGGDMERDYYYTLSRDPADLESIEDVAFKAVDNTLARLGARAIKTNKLPVIFDAQVAGGLLGSFLGAIRGGNIYRKASFLLDKLEQQIFAEHIHIFERPHILKMIGSAPFDNEGLLTRDQDFVKDGILKSYLLSSYSARKLNSQPTANAGGVHNLFIETSDLDRKGLLAKMDKGILITELMGQGVNIVTGDYSRGAAGFWVENGVIQYPIHGFTVAANLKDMFRNIVAIAKDIDFRGNIKSGSILFSEMTIAGD